MLVGQKVLILRAAVRNQYTGCDVAQFLNYFVSLNVKGRQLFLDILQYKTTKGWSDNVLSNILAKTER